MARDWRPLAVLEQPDFFDATSFIGPHRNVFRFLDWHRNAIIEVRAINPHTGRRGLRTPADYAAVDLDKNILTAGGPGLLRWINAEFRFTAPPVPRPHLERRRLFGKALDADPGLQMQEAVELITRTWPEARRVMNVSRRTLFRDFNKAKQQGATQS